MDTALEFEALIEILGMNPYVLVDADKANRLRSNWRKPMPVVVQINSMPDEPWHINMMPMGNGSFYLYLHNDVRKASRTKVGDRVTVTVWFDATYHTGPMHLIPELFQQILDQNTVVAANWSKLPPSRQKEVLRYFAGLKSEAALDRNILRATYVLEGHSTRFMGRDWADGN